MPLSSSHPSSQRSSQRVAGAALAAADAEVLALQQQYALVTAATGACLLQLSRRQLLLVAKIKSAQLVAQQLRNGPAP
jgi:hypothetical protein